MRFVRSIFAVLALIVFMAGCDQQALIDKLTPADEAAIAKDVISKLAAKDFAPIEARLAPEIVNSSTHAALEEAAKVMPPGAPKSITTIGAQTIVGGGVTRYNLTFEYEYPAAWIVANVVLQRRDGQLTVYGLHVNFLPQSLKQTNRFTFAGKGWLHYLVLTLAVVIPLFIIYALVVCVRTPIATRKWLWLIFIALGFVQVSFNWTDGSYLVTPISFAILGSGFFSAGPYAPTIINIAFPLGAIVFLVRRKTLSSGDKRAPAPGAVDAS